MNEVAGRLGIIGTALNLIGLGLSVYLTYEHYAATTFRGCVLGGGCEKVTTSSYSKVLGVPVVLGGLFYFVVSFGLHLPAAWRSTRLWSGRARMGWAWIGMLSVFYLIYGELSVGAICMYCTGVHIVVFALLVLTMIGSALVPPCATIDGIGDASDEVILAVPGNVTGTDS